MSSHHRSGGPPSLMDDVHDFDRNFHSHRFESDRGGRGRGGGGGGMRGRGGGDRGGGRGRGDGNFVPRGGSRGGRGDFHQRDRFNNNFNRSNDDHRSGGSNQSKMPGLLDSDQQQSRPYDRDNNNRHGRMPYSRGGGHDSSGDDRYRHSNSKTSSGDGPPSLLDFGNDKSGLPMSASNNSLPSLLSVQLENSGMPPSGSESDKGNDAHKDYQHGDHSSSRSDHHSSHRDNDNRYRDRDSHRSSRGGYNRSSSYNRDRSRSPRDRDRDRHGGPSREDHPYGGDNRRGGRGGGRDQYGRGGGGGGGSGRGDHHHHHREGHQSRFGPPENGSQPWQDRRGGGRGGFGGGGRGGFQEHQREIGPHRPNEQLPPDNNLFNRDGRPNFDVSSSQNRPFQENFPHGNFDPMSGPPGHNRPNFNPPPNFNQGPPHNRPDFYPPNANNPLYQQHNTRTGGRPSRFSDRQDEYEDDRPLTKPNFSLLNAHTTTAPLYINQPTNPTYSQPRPQMTSTFSSQQQQQQPPPGGMFPPGGPNHPQPPGQFNWPNPQGQQTSIGPNPHMNSALSNNDQSNNFYGNNNDFHRQQHPQAANPYFAGVPPVLPQSGAKPPNVQPNSVAPPSQQQIPSAASANATNTDAWQQYYQQYWQYLQQQQTGVQPPANSMTAQAGFPVLQPGATTAPKQPSAAGSTAGNTPDAVMTQANTEAWTQYWIQCQAYMQQQQQLQQQNQTSSSNGATIAASSQLYPQNTGKQPQTSSNPPSNSNAPNNAPPSSNWQTWFTTK